MKGHVAVGDRHRGNTPKVGGGTQETILVRVHFHNDYVGYVLASYAGAFEADHGARKLPVWRIVESDGKVSLDGVPVSGHHSVKILDGEGNERAHETVSQWPIEAW